MAYIIEFIHHVRRSLSQEKMEVDRKYVYQALKAIRVKVIRDSHPSQQPRAHDGQGSSSKWGIVPSRSSVLADSFLLLLAWRVQLAEFPLVVAPEVRMSPLLELLG